MCLFDFLYDCVEFLFFRHVYGIVHIHTDDRAVGRDLDNVHAVDVTELLLLGEGSTGHAGFFLVFVKEVLERDGCQSLALSSYFYVLFCLDCLMQTIGITAPRHDTAGELIDDQNLVVFDYVVLVAVHQIIGTQRQDHVVLDLQVLRIGEVLDMEEVLARIESNLRRIQFQNSTPSSLKCNDLVLDLDGNRAMLQGAELPLTAKEFAILELLMKYPDKIFSKANLFQSVWNTEYISEDNTLNVHISNLRNKMKAICPDKEFIDTVWGIGYRLHKAEG